MNEIPFLRFFTALATTNADDPDIHAANDYAISLVESNRAALARAEAAESLAYERLEAALFAEQRATDAEVERDAVRVANGVLSEALEATRSTLEALTARVAELEAARRFKRGYPDKPGMYIVRRADGTVGTARYYTDGWNWGAFNTDITRWAEMPEEPTP